MARKQAVSIQDTVETNEEFEEYIVTHIDKLICMEVYSGFCGYCVATSNAIRKSKLELGGDRIAMVKACSDEIDALERFKNKSEPVFLFIVRGKLVRAMFGANGIELCRIVEEELGISEKEAETGEVRRAMQPINEMLSEEAAKEEENFKIEKEYKEASERLQVLTLAARKKRVNERLSKHIKRLNFIMFWPHCHQAHYDLYEKWDMINIQVAAKETVQLNEHSVKEILYMSDVEPNEACLHALLQGEVLVVLFKMFETDTRDFVQLMRYTLYEEIPNLKEEDPPEKQLPPYPAYERYATISKTAREVRRDRHNAKLQKLREEQEERDRLAAEQARLVREAEEEATRLEKIRQEEERMARIAAGLPAEPEPENEPEGELEVKLEDGDGDHIQEEGKEKAETEDNETTATTDVTGDTEGQTEEALPEESPEEEVFQSDVEIEGEEYIPPGGLFIPGLYTAPNELAKANALAFFFPKQVKEHVMVIETEFLPPHVLVIFSADKRNDVMEIAKQYQPEILNMGIFVGDDPYTAEHVAYTVKQYNKMIRLRKHLDRLALMVSRKRSLPLLQLAGLNPLYISADTASGEKECLALFPVGYGDEYEDVASVMEEEIEVQQELPESVEHVPSELHQDNNGEDNDDDVEEDT